MTKPLFGPSLLATALFCFMSPTVLADEPAEKETTPAGWDLPCTGEITLQMVSDYVWRGLNLSEPANGEGGEMANYDLTVGLSTDLERWTGKKLGTLGGFIWWEWYSGQSKLGTDNGTDKHLQEVDYDLHWTYNLADCCADLEPLGCELTVGWIHYTFPHLRGAAHRTSEFYTTLAFDDTAWFGLEKPLLSPTLTLWHDYQDVDGSWLDIGFSHEFTLGDCPMMKDVPLLKEVTMTPSFDIGYDMHYLNSDSSRLATLVYGLTFGLSLADKVGLPEHLGLDMSAFIKFSDARDASTGGEDVFYGGVSLGLTF